MPRQNSHAKQSQLQRFLQLPNDHPVKTLTIAFVLCLVCSALVASTAVLLKPRQMVNEELLAKKREILRAAGLFGEGMNIIHLFKDVETRLVDLETGEYVDHSDPEKFDYARALLDPEFRVELSPEEDIARINVIAKYAPVYLFKKDDEITQIVIPVYGYGLWSTMRAYMAIQNDGVHVAGISFYQHAETPGLGGEISSPQWQQKWVGKRIYDEQGKVKLHLTRISHDRNGSKQQLVYQIDTLSGATITSNGVNYLVQFWLGDRGFGPYFKRHFHKGS